MFYLLGLTAAVIGLLVFCLSSDKGRNTVYARNMTPSKPNPKSTSSTTNKSTETIKHP